MGQVYVFQDDGGTTPMDRLRCKNEDLELQSILEHNPDLLPGDQINPDDPRRWLIIEREMPVPDPVSGSDRWSIDFFFSDQSGIPTFIECKRYEDSRSRREVIGQMLDYAANGHYYWTKSEMRNLAEKNAQKRSMSLDEAIQNLQPDDDLDVDEYFQRIEDNLREGQVRLVFFLEESSMELRSVVDFLNKQMERTEVLIVEARQYMHEGTRIVVPVLFGYTEEARLVKRTVKVTSGTRKQWDEESFFADARSKLDDASMVALRRLYDACVSISDEIKWGKGKIDGSFNPIIHSICNRSFVTVTSRGDFCLNFGHLNDGDAALSFREDLAAFITKELNEDLPSDWRQKHPSLKVDEWAPKVDVVIERLKQLVQKHQEA